MFTKEMDQYFQATKAGALAQAVDHATKSDRLSRRNIRRRNQKLNPRAIWACIVAVWHLMSRPAWALGVIVLAIVLDLVLFSG